ncbi:MAG TPA: hypothetical protein PKW98_17205, partial [Candidatus Wallbacteria bacterium]|nr:hypothetical protein [Candidatus Wallbacteria bacterium]
LSYNANLPTGTNTCEISFKDIAGNFLAVNPNVWSFVIDNGRMQVISDATSPDPQHNSFSKNARNYFTLKMTKTTSGLDTDSITFNVLQGNPPESAQGTVTAEEKSDHYLIKWTLNGAEFAEGKIDVSLTKCHNLAGWNFLNAPYTWVFTYDKTNSFLTVDAQSPSPAPASIQTNSKVPILVKLDDALSGIDPNSITLSIASGGQAPPGADYTIQSNPDQLSYDSLNKILKFNTVNFFPDGKLTVTLKNAKDKAGNTYDTIPAGSLPYSWFFNIDTQNPVNQVTHPANDNEFILSNDDFITATLSEATGIDTNSIKLTLVSLPKTTIENAIAVAPPFLTFTGTNPRDGVLKYDPKQKTPPVQIPDSIVEVYITAKNNSGTNITPNPVKRTYKVDTKGPVIIDGSNPPVVDSRQPAPLSTVGVSATKPVSVKFRLEDLPGGVKKDSITYKFTTTDAAGNVLTDTATPLTFNDISANVVEAVYTLPNANITAGAIPDVCTCEIEILTATDQTAALHPLQARATNKWHFYINNSNPTAINPYPPNGYVTTSSSEEVGITLFHAFGINTSSIEFYYNNTQALFP